jgi:hypothetical protein
VGEVVKLLSVDANLAVQAPDRCEAAMYRLHRVTELPPEVCLSRLVSAQLVRADRYVSVLACPVQARAVM